MTKKFLNMRTRIEFESLLGTLLSTKLFFFIKQFTCIIEYFILSCAIYNYFLLVHKNCSNFTFLVSSFSFGKNNDLWTWILTFHNDSQLFLPCELILNSKVKFKGLIKKIGSKEFYLCSSQLSWTCEWCILSCNNTCELKLEWSKFFIWDGILS